MRLTSAECLTGLEPRAAFAVNEIHRHCWSHKKFAACAGHEGIGALYLSTQHRKNDKNACCPSKLVLTGVLAEKTRAAHLQNFVSQG